MNPHALPPNRMIVYGLTLTVALALVGCAREPGGVDPMPTERFATWLGASFRAEGIATLERLHQDPDQAACSGSESPAPDRLRAIEARARSTIQPPSDGHYLGDWQRGEALAQDGRGMTWTDRTTAAGANGGSCYNCHQLGGQEIAYGTIGPSLHHYAVLHGVTDPAAPSAHTVLEYTWGRIYNSWAYNACSNMPRFGHQRLLDEQQMKDLMALLLDPASPVNRP